MADFTSYLKQIAAEFPRKADLAKALGISAPRLSHALKGTGSYTLNVENCLRLAKVANRPPAEVLRAAGKGEIADLLEHLYPHAGKQTLTSYERDLLDDWHGIPADVREHLRFLIHRSVVPGTAKRKKTA